jgi:hypothetical protein
MANVILLRKLTKKSTLNFGKYKEYTVEHLLGMRKQKDLISMYFKLSTITFIDEILDELGITEEYRIVKPSKNIELYHEFLFATYGKKRKPRKDLLKMRKETLSYRKDFLTRYNHGHR